MSSHITTKKAFFQINPKIVIFDFNMFWKHILCLERFYLRSVTHLWIHKSTKTDRHDMDTQYLNTSRMSPWEMNFRKKYKVWTWNSFWSNVSMSIRSFWLHVSYHIYSFFSYWYTSKKMPISTQKSYKWHFVIYLSTCDISCLSTCYTYIIESLERAFKLSSYRFAESNIESYVFFEKGTLDAALLSNSHTC